MDYRYTQKHLQQAVRAGGRILRRYFGTKVKRTGRTTHADFRTDADVASEKAILQIIRRAFPDYSILAEETGTETKKSDYTVVIDPLDGTNNFYIGAPMFSVLIALLKGKEVVSSVIYIPMTDQLFWAHKNQGAYLGKRRIHVSSVSAITKASVGFNSTYKLSANQFEGMIFSKLLEKKTKRILNNWSPGVDYCLMAQGNVDAIVNNGCEVYDFVAGKLLNREAGAKITDYEGRPEANDLNRYFVASNGTRLHNAIIKLL